MKVFSVALLILSLSFTGCPPTQPLDPAKALTALEASIAAIEVTVGALTVAGKMSIATAAEIEAGLAQAPAIYQGVAQEMSTADSDVLKALKISQLFDPLVRSLSGMSPQAQVWTSIALASIRAFLAFYPTPKGLTLAAAPRRGHSTAFDPGRLSAIARRADALGSKLGALAHH